MMSSAGCRLLIVDDDVMFVQLCRRYLKKWKNKRYEVDSASSISEGLTLIEKNHYHCLVLDYRLPDGKGTDIVKLSEQRDPAWEKPPVIILTASGSQQAAVDAIRSDAVDFMVKVDITSTSLIAAIENVFVKSELQKKIVEGYRELQEAYSKLQRKTEELTAFYHTVSHEIKTPLTALREFMSLIKEGVAGTVNDQQQVLLGHATQCCDTMTRHFNDMLDLTQMDTSGISLNKKPNCLCDVVSYCINSAQGLAEDKKVTLESCLDMALPQCDFDEIRIKQVIANLIDNAIKFTDTGGVVRVSTRFLVQSGCVQLEVTDSGCGIRPGYQDRIFDRLFKVNDGMELEAAQAGLGLGLPIAQQIVNSHNGTISVDSEYGRGSTFSVLLPIRSEPNGRLRSAGI